MAQAGTAQFVGAGLAEKQNRARTTQTRLKSGLRSDLAAGREANRNVFKATPIPTLPQNVTDTLSPEERFAMEQAQMRRQLGPRQFDLPPAVQSTMDQLQRAGIENQEIQNLQRQYQQVSQLKSSLGAGTAEAAAAGGAQNDIMGELSAKAMKELKQFAQKQFAKWAARIVGHGSELFDEWVLPVVVGAFIAFIRLVCSFGPFKNPIIPSFFPMKGLADMADVVVSLLELVLVVIVVSVIILVILFPFIISVGIAAGELALIFDPAAREIFMATFSAAFATVTGN